MKLTSVFIIKEDTPFGNRAGGTPGAAPAPAAQPSGSNQFDNVGSSWQDKSNWKTKKQNTKDDEAKGKLLAKGQGADDLSKAIPHQDEVDKIRGILGKQNYSTFVSKLGARASDAKVRKAIQDLAKEAPLEMSEKETPVQGLIPTQNEVVLDKSLGYPFDHPEKIPPILNGGVADVGDPIVTSGGKYVIDGHHRWSQVFCLNPECSVKAIDISNVQNPINSLKAAQAGIAATVGKVPTAQGGGINLFTVDEQTLRQYVNQSIQKSPQILQAFQQAGIGQSADDVGSYIWNNVQMMQANNKPVQGATSRPLMPQTDPAGGAKGPWLHNAPNPEQIAADNQPVAAGMGKRGQSQGIRTNKARKQQQQRPTESLVRMFEVFGIEVPKNERRIVESDLPKLSSVFKRK